MHILCRSYVAPRLAAALQHAGDARNVGYIGRAAAASPATASFDIHSAELAELVTAALHSDGERSAQAVQ